VVGVVEFQAQTTGVVALLSFTSSQAFFLAASFARAETL
jgi:hypothetical protein